MSQNGLLLARHAQKRSDQPHDGKVLTLKSNLRRTSDGFEIPCWNHAVVRVTFVIDTCDREIIAWGATTGGFDGETVRDLMLLCVECRFDSHRTPHAVEWMTDNGSCYTARGNRRVWSIAGPGAMLYAGSQSGIERDGGIVRKDVQTRLRLCA